VADLFQSVQLNVNNPHFLIMQGRVTKVCESHSVTVDRAHVEQGLLLTA
jgi:structural maintenance of chromosome 2